MHNYTTKQDKTIYRLTLNVHYLGPLYFISGTRPKGMSTTTTTPYRLSRMNKVPAAYGTGGSVWSAGPAKNTFVV